MSNLEQEHRQELLGSAIAPSIIERNFESLDSESAADALLYSPKIERKNDGCVTAKYQKYQSLGDGWMASGVDISIGKPMDWCCFKPDISRQASDGKTIKYEHPPATPTEYFALRVTFADGLRIADYHDLAEAYGEHQGTNNQNDEDHGFWAWAITQKSIPLLITEGAKKAACLLSNGSLAIGLPGIWMGCMKGTDTLKPGIALVAAGREVTVVFDMDEKPKTQKAVNSAAVKIAEACKTAGATTVTRVTWPSSEGKGVDDLIHNYGRGAGIFEGYMLKREEVKELPATGLRSTTEDNQCPVCEDTSGKCATGMGRQGTEAKDGVLCSSRLDEESTPNGWKFGGLSKPDKDGIQKGKFYPASDKQKTGRIVNPLFISTIEDGLQALDPSDLEKRTRVGLHMQAIAYINSPDQNGAALLIRRQLTCPVATTNLAG
jgi:Domain of unknown function (DUF3854)